MNKIKILSTVTILAVLSLLALPLAPPPRPAQAQFSGQSTFGGTSGGTANAQTITIANYPSNLTGIQLSFIAGATNTGPTTLNVSGLGAVTVLRPSSIGPAFLSGAEITSGELVSVTYNGSSYVITSNVDTSPIGKTVEIRGAATPRGTLIEDGSCVSRSTYAPLFSVISTTYGACDGSTTFGLPDSRGTVFAALDNQGANGSANRITTGGSGCNGTTNGLLCGAQSHTLLTANLPAYTPAGSVSTSIAYSLSGAGGFNNQYASGSGSSASFAYNGFFTGTPQGGTSTPYSILQPLLLGRRAIKY